MLYIILGIILLVILAWIIDVLADGGIFVVIGILGLIGVYKFFSWKGILTLIGTCIIGGVIFFFMSTLLEGLAAHDQKKMETAKIMKETQEKKKIQENEDALISELNNNCRWLGYMDEQKWRSKLPNYCDRKYNTSFSEITHNFAVQMEQQNIRQNDEWFKPFLDYILKHPTGVTVTKMLNEVYCPQFSITHTTFEGDLLNTRMYKGTEKISKDVPPLFNKVPADGMNEYLFVPTEYAKHLYGTNGNQNTRQGEEISFDDL